MIYIIVLIFSIPTISYLIDLKNVYRHPVAYSYFLGAQLFIVLGSFYSLDGDNAFYGGNLSSLDYILILIMINLSFFLFRLLPSNVNESKFNVQFSGYNTALKVYYILALFHFVFFILYILRSDYLSFIQLAIFLERASEIIDMRSGIATGSQGNVLFIFYSLSTFLGMLRVSLGVKNKWHYCEVLYFGLTTVLFLHKMPIILFVLFLFFVAVFRAGHINVKRLSLISTFIIFLLFISYVFYFPGREMSFYLLEMPYSIFHRIIGVYSEAVALSIKVVNESDLFLGRTFINPLNLFDFEPVYLPLLLHYEFANKPGSMVVPAVGEIYANFGRIASVIFIMLMPLLIYLIDLISNKYLRNDYMGLALMGYLSYISLKVSQASIFITFLEPKNIILLVFFTFYFYIRKNKHE